MGVCFNTQPPEGGCIGPVGGWLSDEVSTRSRPKAAVALCPNGFSFKMFQHAAARRRLEAKVTPNATKSLFQHAAARRRLKVRGNGKSGKRSFNTQPPEGGCLQHKLAACTHGVSTRSRPKAAAPEQPRPHQTAAVSTRSRPKAAGFT